MIQRDFHRQVRVVYRAMRKLYGMEKVQDECLKVFKVLYPEYYRAKNSDEKYYQLSDKSYDRLDKIVTEWIPEEGVLRDILIYALNEFERCMLREEFVKICEDCMPVVMRIRKLTPREVFRLMDVSDKDIETILSSGISKSACYKLAGNSIVISCLYHIFRKLFIETERDLVKGEAVQLSLF